MRVHKSDELDRTARGRSQPGRDLLRCNRLLPVALWSGAPATTVESAFGSRDT